jgi:hypothetical protein
MASCPACGRGIALARELCLYCGAPLGPAGVPVPAGAPSPDTPQPEPSARLLVLIDLARTDAAMLAPALAVSPYEAGLLMRRGGLLLVRAAGDAAAAAEAERLRALGAEPLVVPEAEVRAGPVLCVAGEPRADGLLLRSAQGSLTLAPGETFLVVSGPITREHQATDERRKMLTARLDEGFRIQLHRRQTLAPLEIDATNFEVGFAVSGSVRLELESWLEAVAKDARRDTGFSRLPAVLAPAEPEPKGGALAAAGSLRAAARGEGEGLVLDNLAQFRFYSGCLAAVERRL